MRNDVFIYQFKNIKFYIHVISYFRINGLWWWYQHLCENVEIHRLLKPLQRTAFAAKSLFARSFSQR